MKVKMNMIDQPNSQSKKTKKIAKPRMTFTDAMDALQQAGSEQTCKTYLRHGATEPMFGVSFATLKILHKNIGVDHELALALWDSGNLDARNLAVKIVDPLQMSPLLLDAWARRDVPRACGTYVADVASEGEHAMPCVTAWLTSQNEAQQATGWSLVGVLAMRDLHLPDTWFLDGLAEIEKLIHHAPNRLRIPMNQAMISIGCRNLALRDMATISANRIGKVSVDHGDTACKTAIATESINKAWAHSSSKGFVSPAEHERTRESTRLRC